MELRELLETVDEFGVASVELVAWEFSVDPDDLASVWRGAVADGLLRWRHTDPSGESVYQLTNRGKAVLQASDLRQDSRRRSAEQG